MMNNYDFIISGAGLVGCLLATRLSNAGYKCCLIEKNKVINHPEKTNYSPLSLNYKSYLILNNFGLWKNISPHVHPINNLTIKSYNSLNKVRFSSKDIHLDSLGFVIHRNKLLDIFIDLVLNDADLDIFDEDTVKTLDDKFNDNSQVSLTLNSGKKILGERLIVSDGVKSHIKDILGIKSKIIDYKQTSYVFNAEADFEKNSAIQIFNKHGIFAGIPYGDKDLNLILSIKEAEESIFLNSNMNLNISLIHDIFKNYCNNISNLRYVSKYKLITSRALSIFHDKIILFGNSSQLLHPVGAQGFNLAINTISLLMNSLTTNNLNIDTLSMNINNLRQSVFNNIDLATSIFAADKIPSKLLTFITLNSLKRSNSLKNHFLKKIIGIDNVSYLKIGRS